MKFTNPAEFEGQPVMLGRRSEQLGHHEVGKLEMTSLHSSSPCCVAHASSSSAKPACCCQQHREATMWTPASYINSSSSPWWPIFHSWVEFFDRNLPTNLTKNEKSSFATKSRVHKLPIDEHKHLNCCWRKGTRMGSLLHFHSEQHVSKFHWETVIKFEGEGKKGGGKWNQMFLKLMIWACTCPENYIKFIFYSIQTSLWSLCRGRQSLLHCVVKSR